MKLCLLALLASLLLGVPLQRAAAQPAVLEGVVTDEDGLPIRYATVFVVPAKRGATADSNGRYRIDGLPAGGYVASGSSVGYSSVRHTGTLPAGGAVTRDFRLKAQQALNEVVVTGVGRATAVRDNPVAIVAISAKALRETSGSNIIDVLVKNAPGLNAVNTGPNVSKPFIRGLGYNRVLTLYDGVRQEGQQWGDEHGIEVDAYNIDRGEVIKGPSSLMYGSDALAGVVSLLPWVPARGTRGLQGQLTSEYQGNNGLVGNGLRLGMAGPHWLAALRGSYRLARAYRNAVDGFVYNTGFEERNLSGLVGYRSARGHTYLNMTLYDNLQGIPDGSRDSLTRRFTRQVDEGAQDDVTARPVVPGADLRSYRLSPLHQHIRHHRLYATGQYRLGQGEIDALLGWQQNQRIEYNHPTVPDQPGMNVRLNTLNYSLRYNAPRVGGLELSAGVGGMVQQNKSLDATDFPIPDYRLADGGVFGYAKWKHGQWVLSGGLRYDLRQVTWDDFYVRSGASGFDRQAPAGAAAGAVRQFAAFQKLYAGLSASAGVAYEASRNLVLKANIARGYRAPNITETGSNGLDPGAHIIYKGNRSFRPEFSLQEDLGALFTFRDVSGSVSVFNNHIQDYIYLTLLADDAGNAIVDAQGNKTYQYQQAAARLWGGEASLALHPQGWRGFRFDNNLALVYGANTRFAREAGTAGRYLPLIPPPRLSSSLAQKIAWRTGMVASLTPRATLEYNAAQNRYLGLNGSETATPAYALVHLSLGAEIRYRKAATLQLNAGVDNLLDQAYQSALSRLKYFEYYTASPNGRAGIYGMGRNAYVKLVVPF